MTTRRQLDPAEIAVIGHALHSVAVEMGAALRRTAFSPNIKERRDYSSAVFSAEGDLIAMGDDMPVHLGSMPMSVAAVLADLRLAPGDVALLNDPYRGGTHLPDITMVAPVFLPGRNTRRILRRQPRPSRRRRRHVSRLHGPLPRNRTGRHPHSARQAHARRQNGYATSRHHSRQCAHAERTRRRPHRATRRLPHRRNPHARTRQPLQPTHDCLQGSTRMLAGSERLMQNVLASLPAGEWHAEDFLDDDGVIPGPIAIRVKITNDPKRRRAVVDFAGTDPQVPGSINAVYAITWSAVFYVFRCLLPPGAIATAGLMRPIQVLAPDGSIVNARPPAAVAGGNVETSQRIVDTLMRALAPALPDRIPAASSGTMNNLTIGGIDPRRSRPALHLLRNHRRRSRRFAAISRSQRPSRPHDQLAQHSRRSARVRLSLPHDSLRAPPELRRSREAPRRRRHHSRDGIARRRASHSPRRSPQHATMGTRRRRSRRSWSNHYHSIDNAEEESPRQMHPRTQSRHPHPHRIPRRRRLGQTRLLSNLD